jgi:hypothetical protein
MVPIQREKLQKKQQLDLDLCVCDAVALEKSLHVSLDCQVI